MIISRVYTLALETKLWAFSTNYSGPLWLCIHSISNPVKAGLSASAPKPIPRPVYMDAHLYETHEGTVDKYASANSSRRNVTRQ